MTRELSPREVQALAEYAVHGSTKDASACMIVTEQTLKNHLNTARAKLDVHSTVEAIHALGWIRVPKGALEEHKERP